MTKQQLIAALAPYPDEAEVAVHVDGVEGTTASLDIATGESEDGEYVFWDQLLEGSAEEEGYVVEL